MLPNLVHVPPLLPASPTRRSSDLSAPVIVPSEAARPFTEPTVTQPPAIPVVLFVCAPFRRSEERRVGKEWRTQPPPSHYTKKSEPSVALCIAILPAPAAVSVMLLN